MAESLGGSNSISFAVGVGGGQITLTSGEIDITDENLTINGPANISGDSLSRIFHVENGSLLGLNNLTLLSGKTSGNGGAILVDTPSATVAESLNVDDVNFVNNTSGAAGGRGGAIAFLGSTTLAASTRIINSQFTGNTSGSIGGAVDFSGGSLLIQGSSFSQDTATFLGGALSVDAGAAMVQASTFDGNSAKFGGAIIDNSNSATLGIYATTIARNSAQYGGGIEDTVTQAASLQDSIVAGNTATTRGPDFDGNVKSLGYNLFKSISNTTFTTGQQSTDIVSTTPGVGTLGNYGGPTPTDPLLPGSPALMHGLNDNGGVDQRGVSLVDNTSYSIGAFFGVGLLVTSTDDNGGVNPAPGAGTGTLRQAIVDSNFYASGDGQATVAFDIGGGGTQTITLQDVLPNVAAATDVDASTQPGYGSSPIVNLLAATGTISYGFEITADSVTIRGLAIGGFGSYGIVTHRVNALTVAGDFFGLAADSSAEPNGTGLVVNGSNILIGGPNPNDRNVIADNTNEGLLFIDATASNLVENNLVGVTFTDDSVPNQGDGIELAAEGVTVGAPGLGNLIENNMGQGIELDSSSGSDLIQSNTVLNNGDFSAGLGAYAFYGLNIASNNNTIGGTDSSYANVFNQTGVHIGGGSSGNLLENNRIGTDDTGTQGLGTYYDGIDIDGGANHNTIGAGNVISANADGDGINISGVGTSSNLVTSSFIGTDITGTSDLFNDYGVEVQAGASSNTITASVISGNTNDGVTIHDFGTSGNVISADKIGTDVTGSFGGLNYGLENDGDGVEIYSGATNNTISGDVISGNANANVSLSEPGTSLNDIQGNLIGTDATGEYAIDTSGFTSTYGIYIGGPAFANVVQSNVISGNTNTGIFLTNAANNNQITGNKIGLDKLGQVALPNDGDGIWLDNSAGGSPFQNQIGGAGALGNTISGNVSNGVEISEELAPTGLTNWISGDGTTLDSATGGSVGVSGTVSYAPAQVGQGFSFGGGQVDTGIAAFGTNNFSLAFEVKTTQSGRVSLVSDADNNAADGYIDLELINGQVSGKIFDPAGGLSTFGGTYINDGNFHQVVLTRSGQSVTLFVDGSVVNHVTTYPLNLQTAQPLLIGDSAGDASLGTSPFQGTITQFQVYNRSLSLTDIRTLGNDISNPMGGNVIQGNRIGTDTTGAFAIPNQAAGIHTSSSSYDLIGGVGAGVGNTISGNLLGGVTLSNTNLPAGLANAYSAEGNALDSWGNADGSIVGTVGYAPGKVGQAFNFPAGQDNHVVAPIATFGTSDFTVSFWVQTLDNGANVPLFGDRSTSGYGNFLDISLRSGQVHAEVEGGVGDNDIIVTPAELVDDGAYHLITVTRSALTLTVYIDGITDSNSYGTSGAISVLSAGSPYEIGSEPLVGITNSPTYTSFVGQIDEVQVYNRALQQSDVTNLESQGNEGGARIFGNYVGTNSAGNAAISNGLPNNGDSGIVVSGTENGDIIGGTLAGAGNVIAGNYGSDVVITGELTSGDLIQGNIIGLDANGDGPVSGDPALNVELAIQSGGNTVGGLTAAARNVIASGGNAGGSVALVGQSASGNLFEGNYVGTDKTGTVNLASYYGEISESGGSRGNTYGGTVAGAGNLVVGMGHSGVGTGLIHGSSDDLVAGNLLDTNYLGNVLLGQTYSGITLTGSNNTVGGTVAAARNVLPTDSLDVQQNNNLVEGNYVGFDISGLLKLAGTVYGGISAEGYGNTIGGTVAGAGNLVGNVQGDGIDLDGVNSQDNSVEGNLVGTDKTGKKAARIAGAAVSINSGATGNFVGGYDAADLNVLSGAATGVVIGVGSIFNFVVGDYIGTDITGTVPISDTNGLVIFSSENVIGASGSGAANVIAAEGYGGGDPNTGFGIWLEGPGANDNIVSLNRIGIGATGALIGGATNAGIRIDGSNNTIGNANLLPNHQNVISGTLGGIDIDGTASDNVVQENYIGTDLTGTVGLGNGNSVGGATVYYGVEISGGSGNTIGGLIAGSANVLASNYFGVYIAGGTDNTVEGNLIGTDKTGTKALPNYTGIRIGSTANTVGGTAAGAGNVIAFNQGVGIEIQSPGAAYSSVRENRIVGNAEGGISVAASGAAFVAPTLAEASVIGQVLDVRGTSVAGATLEFYVAAAGQGDVYLGTGTEGTTQDTNATSGSYLFSFAIPTGVTVNLGDSIVAISVATPVSGSNPSLRPTTSPFSNPIVSDSGPAFGGPVVVAGGGGTVVVGSTFTSQGAFTDTTSESWTATIDYHDNTDGTDTGPLTLVINPVTMTPGSGDQYSDIGDATYNISHKFTKVGNYSVTIKVTNDSGEVGASGFAVNVVAAPVTISDTNITLAPAATPTITTSPAIINEDQSVVLHGKFADATPGTTHGVTIIWGDGTTSSNLSPIDPVMINEATGTFTAIHPYLDPGTYNSASGLFTVEAQVTSNAGTTASTTYGLFYVQVDDVAPTRLALTTSSATVVEGNAANFSLSGTFVAPGPLDSHVVTIDWGDGSPDSKITLGPGVLAIPSTAHDYKDYPRGAVGSAYPITVSVNDFYQPLLPATATASVVVTPAPVTGIALNTSLATISEGGTFSVSGSFAASGPLDHHEVVVSWGDGTTSPPVFLGAGVTSFSAISHSYAKSSIGRPNGAFPVTVTIIDPNAPALTTASAATSVVVNDVASAVSNLVAKFMGNGVTGVVAGSTVALSGTYTTPNPGDTYSLLVSWGDGTTSTVPVSYLPTATAPGTFTASHYYADANNVSASNLTSSDDIHVTVKDAEGTTGFGDLYLGVTHLAPVVQVRSGGFSTSGGQILSALTSGDATGIKSYSWTVNGVSSTITSSTFPLPNSPGDYLVSSVATDFDNVSSVRFTALVHVLDNSSTTYLVPNTPGVDEVFVSAGSGTRTVIGGTVRTNPDGSTMRDAHGIPILALTDAVPIVFDGTGQETFIGDIAADVFNLHTDGSKAYGEGGNNVFVLTPNCTLEADVDSGQNTIDFSSSTYGVTFSLASTVDTTNTPVKQDVDPVAQPGDHFVIADASGSGTFSTLIGSSGNDSLTAASNTTIDGGGGTDTIAISSTAGNTVGGVTIGGSTGGDDVNVSGPSVGDITFQAQAFAPPGTGQADTDVLTNTGSISGTVTYNGGADTSILANMGTISGSVMYNGGSDGASLMNMGTISGTVTYNGGADATGLVNSANAILGGVIFNGGADTGSLTNMGTITGTVVYNAGSDGDSIENLGTIAAIKFTGNTGGDLLTNNGIILGDLGYGGGADADTLTNAGTIGGTVTYSGGSDAGTLTNSGSISGNVTYGGGSDTDTLTNAGTIGGTVTYNGGSDAGTLVNQGTIAGTVMYNGGSDADTLANRAGGMIGGVIFRGGADASTLTNAGTISGNVMYGGGSDSNVFTNGGSVGGTVTYSGGADTGSLTNTGTISGNVTYGGGSDTDTLTNAGTIGGTVTYSGGSDAGTLANSGTISGLVTYGGGSDSNSLTNTGLLGLGVTYDGGADSGSLVNMGTISGTVTYNGGSDTQVLAGQGTISGTVTYNGGADTDTLANAGSISGTVTYNGGSDAGSLMNTGTITGSVMYNGGSDTDLLTNAGTISGTVTYNGGADSGATVGEKELVNTGLVAAINFQGGQGANGGVNNNSELSGVDVLINRGTVTGGITLDGDGDADQLLNATGAAAGSILFNGGADTNLLEDDGSVLASVLFNSAGDASVLTNTGTVSGTVTYNGGSDTDVLLNSGDGGPGSAIVFNGGAGTSTVFNGGKSIASIRYAGGAGASTLINTGDSVGSISFAGGGDGSQFLNAGNSVGAIVFEGGLGANVFNNDGLQVGSITYDGSSGTGYVLNSGTVGAINYLAGSDADALVNNGTVGSSTLTGINFTGGSAADEVLNTTIGVIDGLSFAGGSNTNDLENDGTLADATADFAASPDAGQFLNVPGASATNITYDAGSDSDQFLNYGGLAGAAYHGGVGVGSMYLDGTTNANVTYVGGANGDEVFIGPDATAVSAVDFRGGAGTDLFVNESAGARGLSFEGGAGASTFWSLANNAVGLGFTGGSGAATFENTGSGVTGIVFTGGSGVNTLTNTGANVGTIADYGGPGAGTLTNSGIDTTSIVYDGGSSSDTLTNTAAAAGVGSITYTGSTGNGTVTNDANGVGLIAYFGGTGVETLTNAGNSVAAIHFVAQGPSAEFNDSGSVGSLTFAGGAGFASFNYSATGGSGSTVQFTAAGGGNIFVDSGYATAATASLGSGDNQAVILTGAAGNVTLTGGDGDNTYLFSGTPQANVTINQALFADIGSITTAGGTPVYLANPGNTTGGVDTLDFSAYLGGGVAVDLLSTAPQAIAGGLTLTLTDAEGFSRVVGSQYSNQIYGNYRPDALSTSDLPDARVSTAPNNASTFVADARTQYVFLDFDSYTVAGDMTYSASDRSAILADIQADYYGPVAGQRWFDVDIEDNLALIPSNLVQSGQYAILYFNRTPPSGLPGGEASEIDPGNTDFGGYASIQVNGMIGGGDQPAATDANFIALSAKVSAHELEHLMGVRHSDAFGPIGFGVHTPPGATGFNPTYDGPDDAFETFDHIISSPATVGSTRFNDLRGLDIGPREAIKLAFDSKGTTVTAAAGAQSTMATARAISLAPLAVPNTDVTLNDVEKSLIFQVGVLDVRGTIGLDPATGLAGSDYYALSGQAGDVDTIEVDSQEDERVADADQTFDSVVTLYDASGRVIAVNDDQYEGTDSLLMDVTLPTTGTYYIRVSSFAATPGDPEYDPASPTSPLNPGNLQSILNPLNPDYSPSALATFLQAKAGTEAGQYDLFVYRFDEADPTAANVNNTLVARGPGSTLSGSTGTDTLIGPAGTTFNDTNSGATGAIAIVPTVSAPSVDLNSPFQDSVKLNGPTGANAWTVTIGYGDGSAPVVQTIAAGSTISLSHPYQAVGAYTATLSIRTGVGTFGTSIPVSVTASLAPAGSITGPAAGTTSPSNAPVTFTGSIQAPYAGLSYQATWTFTNASNPSLFYTTTQTVSTATAAPTLAFSTSQSFPTSGTYNVQLTIKDLANGLSTTVQTAAQVIILQYVSTTTTVVAPASTYNGQGYSMASATVVGANQGVVNSPSLTYAYYLSTDTGLKSPLSAAPVDAGSYLVVASFAGNASYAPSTSSPVGFSIGRATPRLTATPVASTPYTASPYAGASGVLLGVSGVVANPALTYTYYASGGATPLAGAPTHGGSYTVVANYAATTDYFAATSAAAPFTITAVAPTVKPPTAPGITYSGSPYASASTTVTGIGGAVITTTAVTFTYYIAGSTTPLSAAPTDAGNYTVVASYAGNTDYSAGMSTATAFTIAKFSPTAKATPLATTPYTAAPYAGASATATGVGGATIANPTFTYTYFSGATPLSAAPTDAGTYSVVANYVASTDYFAASSAAVPFVITAVAPTVKPPTAPGATYNGSPYASASTTVTGIGGAVITTTAVTFTYYIAGSTTPLSAAPTDAGNYTVVASYAGNTDYTSGLSTATPFTIAKFAPTAKATPPATTPYTAAPYAGASATATGVGGATIANPTFTYTYFSGTTPLSAAPTDAGTYSVVATYVASTDYFAASSAAVPFVITAIAPTVKPPTAPGITYSGSPYASASTTVTGIGGVVITTSAVTFTYYASGSTTPLSAAPTDAGNYTVVASYAGNTDYSAGMSTATAFTIAKFAPTAKATPLATTPYTAAPYAGASATATGVGGATIANPTFTYTYFSGATPLSAAPTDAGTYSVVATYVASTDYFAASSAAVPFVITAIAPTVKPPTAPGITYSGSPYASASTTVTGIGGVVITTSAVTFTYYVSGSTTPLSAAPTDAGSYTVVASYAGNTDYSAATSAATPFAIAQAASTVVLSAKTTVYTSVAYAGASATVAGLGGASIGSATLSYATAASPNTPLSGAPTAVGSYQVTASFAGSTDYKAAPATTATFSITAAPLAVTIADASKAYGAVATLAGSIAGLLGKDPITAAYASPGSSASAAIGTYPITATLSDAGTGTLADYAVTYRNAAGTLTTGTLTVTAAGTATVVAATTQTTNYGSPVLFIATITDTATAAVPAGSVEFYDGTTDLGHGVLNTNTSNSANWTLVSATLSPGKHSITAVYTPTANFQASSSTSTPYLETIVGGPTTTTLSASAPTIDFGQAETFTATVLVGSTPAPGVVDFYDTTTATDLGTATLNASGVATLATGIPLPTGAQSILASYAANGGFTASSATATASVLASIYVLNPTLSGALNLSGSSTITVPGLVQVDSSSASAIVESGSTKTTASAIRVVGGTSVSGSSTFSTTPVKGAAMVADPLVGLPIPPATGLASYGAVNIGGVTSLTISPGIYTSISVTASATLKMNPGIYVITGGGFAVNGAASVSGGGVLIYNAGSNYNGGSGTTYGGITIDGSGKVTLSAPTSGPYAGIVIFQSRDNARLVEMSGATVASLGGGVIYAASAQLNLGGSAQLGSAQSASPVVVNQLVLSGNVMSDLLAGGGGGTDGPDVAGQLAAGIVSVYVDDSSGGFTPDELDRIADAVASADATVAPFGSDVVEVSDPALATTTISIGSTSPAGSATDGVLGCEVPGGIDLVTGWDWYAGADPGQVPADRYDFETIVLHEIGHALGLGHSQDPTSTMFATLETGLAKRALATADLDIPDTDSGPCGLHAATDAGLDPVHPAAPVAIIPAQPASAEVPIGPDPSSGLAAPARKAEAPARPAAPLPPPRPAATPRPRQASALDRAIDQWDHQPDDPIDSLAREIAKAKTGRP